VTLIGRIEVTPEDLNSQRIEPDDLPETLRAQISGRTSRIVFFDANSDVPYAEAIHAIDLIEQSSGKAVLLTPETKKGPHPLSVKAGANSCVA
jgi:biopolymer transport protein ExbD